MIINPSPSEERRREVPPDSVMFSQGFRPFFLCAGIVAVVIMMVWLLGYTKRNPLLTYYGSSGWHAHEMLFGYMTAVFAGFLLAAARDRRKAKPLSGAVLIVLLGLWLGGRVLPVLE